MPLLLSRCEALRSAGSAIMPGHEGAIPRSHPYTSCGSRCTRRHEEEARLGGLLLGCGLRLVFYWMRVERRDKVRSHYVFNVLDLQ